MILKGKKVVLRPAQLEDAPRFVKWFNDKTVNKFLAVRSMTLKDERQYINNRLKGKVKNDLHFCMDTVDGTHIGAVGLHHINKTDGYAMFGIMIGDKNFWDKGLGSEAARLIIDYGFKKLKLHRIELEVHENNPRAIKVYDRLGFKVEARKRERLKYNNKFYDSILMAVLDREWKKLNK